MSAVSSAAARNPIRVLVADDDPFLRSMMRARLARVNAQTVEAEDGLAAWNLLDSQTFDMAIVDLGMPNVDGISLIQSIRSNPRTRHLPVIVVTAQDDRSSIERSFEAGACSFLIKPVVWATFEHHIGFLLRLIETERNARMSKRQATAAARAQETILGNLCVAMSATAATIRQHVEFINGAAGFDGSATKLSRRLHQISDDCIAMQSLAISAEAALKEVSENVAVGDSKASLADLVDRVVEVLQPKSDEAGVRLAASVPPGNTILSCDSDSIVLALTHLVDNAIAHSHPGGTVTLEAKLYPDGLLGLEVEDHGAGMRPEVLAHHLAPLQAAYDGSQARDNIGLGLLLAKAIVEAHNGALELRTASGRGTIATLVIPGDRVVHTENAPPTAEDGRLGEAAG